MSASAWSPVNETPSAWTPVDEHGLGMSGAPLTDRTVPNARLRNLPNPAAGETSALGAFYHGAKTGATLGMLPALPGALTPSIVPAIAGGVVGSVAGKNMAKAAGAGDLGQEMAGDAGGIAGGAVAGGASDWAATKARAIYNALPEAVQKELLGVISPRYAHAARVLDALGIGKPDEPVYPGASQPATPPKEVLQATSLTRGPHTVVDPAAGLDRIPVRNPGAAGSMAQSVAPPQVAQPSSPAAPIAEVPAATPPIAAAAPTAVVPKKLGTLSDLQGGINDALGGKTAHELAGGKPVEPGQPIYQRKPATNLQQQLKDSVPSAAKQTPKGTLSDLQGQIKASTQPPLPDDFTPLPDSSLLKGYKYDASKQQFSAVLNNGESYVHGEVSPDQVKAFEAAESQGSAWTKKIKQGPGTVLVEKNGLPVKKMKALASSDGDLTDILTKSVANAKKGTQ